LLVEPLYSSQVLPAPFIVAANVGVFFAVKQEPLVPDVFVSLGVQMPADWSQKRNRSYFVWEFGKVPEVVIEIVEAFLENTPADQAVIFDGLPRKVTQKDLFEEAVSKAEREPLAVLIHLDDEVSVQRLSNRWMSKATSKIYPSKEEALKHEEVDDLYQRADDVPDAIRTRLETYHRETQPVIDW